MRRLHLLPDTDGEIRAVAEGLEELLLVCRSDDPNEDPELFPDPGDAVTRPAIDVGAEAVGRIAVALRAADDAPTTRMLAPDGHYELVPLRQVELDDEDLERLGAAVRELGRATLPGGDEFVAEYLRESGAPWSAPSPLPRGGTDPAQEVVARVAALHGVLTLPDDPDTLYLAERFPDRHGDWVVTGNELAAYDRLVKRCLAIWSTTVDGLVDPLARWIFEGGRQDG